MAAFLFRTASYIASQTEELIRPTTIWSGSVRRLSSRAHPPSTSALSPDSTIDAAVKAACVALKREHGHAEAELAKKLVDNWYCNADDVAGMTDQQALALGCPIRLKDTIADMLDSGLSGIDHVCEGLNVGSEKIEQHPGNTTETSFNTEIDASGPSFAALEALSIDERVCPPLYRFGNKYKSKPNVVQRQKPTKYRLALGEMSPALVEELEALRRFGTVRFFGAQADPIAQVTAKKYEDHIRGMLGWLHRERGIPVGELRLRSLVPSAGREGVALLFDYLQWLGSERDIAVRTELLVLRSILFAAKFLYHDLSSVRSGDGEKPYSDLDVVKEMRILISTSRKAAKIAPRVADESAKWLDWPEYLQACRELHRECAALNSDGSLRPRSEVAWSIQRYLIFAILASVPDRQRTIRELEVGRTLVSEDGRWVIRHGPGDYKTGRSYGERPPLVLNSRIYPELEAFITTWRSELSPLHGRLFTQANGQPLTTESLYKLFYTTAFRITGRRCTPHMVRDSIVTFLRGGNATERELEALALFMGHSIEMQRASYDRRTKEQKVEPAVALLESLNDLESVKLRERL